MITFKTNKEYKIIYDYLKNEGILNDKASFKCYVDGMFDYHLEKNGKEYHFTILAEDENFIAEQEVSWLIDLKKVGYFELSSDDFYKVFNINKNVN